MKPRCLVPWFVVRRDYGVMRQRRFRWKPRVNKWHPFWHGCSWMRRYRAMAWLDKHSWPRKSWINPDTRLDSKKEPSRG